MLLLIPLPSSLMTLRYRFYSYKSWSKSLTPFFCIHKNYNFFIWVFLIWWKLLTPFFYIIQIWTFFIWVFIKIWTFFIWVYFNSLLLECLISCHAFNGFKFLLQFKESVAQFAAENIAPHASKIDHTNYFPKVCFISILVFCNDPKFCWQNSKLIVQF
jgi:hypothetical protein